jgi:hypothetical protein
MRYSSILCTWEHLRDRETNQFDAQPGSEAPDSPDFLEDLPGCGRLDAVAPLRAAPAMPMAANAEAFVT